MRSRPVVVLALFLVATLAPSPAAAQAAPAKWTILAYLNADNDLEPFILTNLQEMEAEGFPAEVRLVALVDRDRDYDARDGNWVEARRYEGRAAPSADGHAGGDAFASSRIDDVGEIDMAAMATLRDFLVWGAQQAPADRYFILLSSHGAAWDGALNDHDAGQGEGSPSMSVTDIGRALKEARQQLGRAAKWDLVYFDQCLMATAVMSHALAEEVQVMMAAEELTPGEGAAFPEMMRTFKAQPTADARTLAAGVLAGFKAKYHDSGHPQGVWAVLSWLDLRHEPAFWTAFQAFQQALLAAQGEEALAVLRAAKATERFQYPDLKSSQALDAYDFADQVAKVFPSGPLREAADALAATRSSFVGGALAAKDRPNAKGITMQFDVPGGFAEKPASPTAPANPSAGANLGAAIAAEAASADSADPVIARFEVTVREARPGAPVRFSAEVTDPNLYTLEGVVTSQEEGRHVVQRFLTGTHSVQGAVTTGAFTWDGQVHALVGNGAPSPTATYRADPASATLTVDGVYQRGGTGPVFNASLDFNEATGTFISAFEFTDDGAGEIAVQAGDVFTPITFAFSEDEDDAVEIAGAPVAALAGASPWRLSLVAAAPGTYGVSVYAEDLVGRSASTAVEPVTLAAVAASPSPAPSPPPPPPGGDADAPEGPDVRPAPGLEGLALLGVAAVALLVRRRRA